MPFWERHTRTHTKKDLVQSSFESYSNVVVIVNVDVILFLLLSVRNLFSEVNLKQVAIEQAAGSRQAKEANGSWIKRVLSVSKLSGRLK